MASINWVVNEDARSSTDGLGPRSVNQSYVVTYLPKASIPDRGKWRTRRLGGLTRGDCLCARLGCQNTVL